MEVYVCDVCGYRYDPEVGDPDNGIAPGTKFEDLPEDWVCPLCGVGKDQFSKEYPPLCKKRTAFGAPFFCCQSTLVISSSSQLTSNSSRLRP